MPDNNDITYTNGDSGGNDSSSHASSDNSHWDDYVTGNLGNKNLEIIIGNTVITNSIATSEATGTVETTASTEDTENTEYIEKFEQSQTSTSSNNLTDSLQLRKTYKKVSWVWAYFCCDPTGHSYCLPCIYYNLHKRVTYDKHTGTSTLARHLLAVHNIEKSSVPRVNFLMVEIADKALRHKSEIDAEHFAEICKSLSRLVVDDQLPFCMVESNAFRKFSKTLNRYFDGISRRSLGREILKDYHENRVKLQKVLNQITGAVAITCDGWSSCVYCGFCNYLSLAY